MVDLPPDMCHKDLLEWVKHEFEDWLSVSSVRISPAAMVFREKDERTKAANRDWRIGGYLIKFEESSSDADGVGCYSQPFYLEREQGERASETAARGRALSREISKEVGRVYSSLRKVRHW